MTTRSFASIFAGLTRLTGACAIGLVAVASFGVMAGQPMAPQGPGRGAPPSLDPCGGRSAQPEVPCAGDVEKMMQVLPPKAPAAPKQPRKVLVYGHASGYQHSSIPLAAKTIEAMGRKTAAWTTDISYDPAVMSADNLKQ
jgi:hypothetical protein